MHIQLLIGIFCCGGVINEDFFVNLYKEYTSLESRELEELPRFGVMTWQPFQLP